MRAFLYLEREGNITPGKGPPAPGNEHNEHADKHKQGVSVSLKTGIWSTALFWENGKAVASGGQKNHQYSLQNFHACQLTRHAQQVFTIKPPRQPHDTGQKTIFPEAASGTELERNLVLT